MRITHRYLGYFAAGIMAVYALSGVLLIYRDAQVEVTRTGLVLVPSRTHVPFRGLKELASGSA